MFLKSLDIYGFKSFADHTHVEFSDGITALLGPNGCGKSNVVDAVKWVLGEQSAKNMRADKMEDIIFNGTETRKPLNVAEVVLTISNEAGLLPLDISEITIKRRLFRSGEGEYWINGTLAKLKDVRELFWDTGVGKAAYSVMEQGKIDQILSNKPEDRRYIFEEAAGITRFKARRAEAERKLERTEENMKQVDGILGEVKHRYDSLKIQAEKTTEFRVLTDKVFELERDIQLLKLKGFVQDKFNREADIKKNTEMRDKLRAEIDAIHAELDEHMDEVNSMETELVDLQKKIFELAVTKNSRVSELGQLNERQNETKQKINQLEGRQAGLEEQIEDVRGDVDDQGAQVHDLTKRLGEITKNITSFEENIELAGNRITENDRRSAEAEQAIRDLEEKRAEMQERLEAITEDIVTQLDSKLRSAGYSSQSRQKAQDEVNTLLSQLKILAEGRRHIFEDFAKLKGPSEADVAKFTASAVSSFTELETLSGRLSDAFDGFVETTPQFIDEFLSPEGIITKKRGIDSEIEQNRAQVAEKRDVIGSLKAENSELVTKIDEYRKTLEGMRINKAQMEAQITAAEEHLKLLKRQLAVFEAQLRELQNELFDANKQYDDLADQILEKDGEIQSMERQGIKMTEDLTNLESTIANRNTDVAGKKKELEKKNEERDRYQSLIEKANFSAATVDVEIRTLKENFRDAHSRDLMEFEERMYTIDRQPAEMREELSGVRTKLKALGNVNFMAVEEFAETKERYEFLTAQMADLQKARDDLRRITEEIRAESTEQFLATYNKIKKNFHNMFRRLFGGGRAELRLVDPQNVLESGIDIFAQPPGKKLENIALLSGGEKTMTAVSLLFATYMVRPSPFCLLDEIDAALDEQNVLRFVQTLREFGNISQYIVITHNKKTVAGAGTMLGVTMEESGVSKVITIKLEENGRIILPDPEPFEEEDVAPEENVVIPPHPPKRVHGSSVPSGIIVEKMQKTGEPVDNNEEAGGAVTDSAESSAVETSDNPDSTQGGGTNGEGSDS